MPHLIMAPKIFLCSQKAFSLSLFYWHPFIEIRQIQYYNKPRYAKLRDTHSTLLFLWFCPFLWCSTLLSYHMWCDSAEVERRTGILNGHAGVSSNPSLCSFSNLFWINFHSDKYAADQFLLFQVRFQKLDSYLL